jgi:plasmid stability protein
MAILHVRNVPDDLYRQLQQRAATERRSLRAVAGERGPANAAPGTYGMGRLWSPPQPEHGCARCSPASRSARSRRCWP